MSFEKYFSKETQTEIEKLKKENVMAFRKLGELTILKEGDYISEPEENDQSEAKAKAMETMLTAQIALNKEKLVKLGNAKAKKPTADSDKKLVGLQAAYSKALDAYNKAK